MIPNENGFANVEATRSPRRGHALPVYKRFCKETFVRFISCFLFLLFASTGFAGTNFIARLTQYETNLHSMDSAMTYVIAGFGKEKLTMTGKFAFKKPGRTRIEYVSPQSYLMIRNGEEVYSKNGDTSSVLTPQQMQMAFDMDDMYQSHFLGQYIFDQPPENRDNGTIKFEGFVMENNARVKRIDLYLDAGTGLVKEYRLVGNAVAPQITVHFSYKAVSGIPVPEEISSTVRMNMGQMSSSVLFSGIRVNQSVPDGLFRIPKQ